MAKGSRRDKTGMVKSVTDLEDDENNSAGMGASGFLRIDKVVQGGLEARAKRRI